MTEQRKGNMFSVLADSSDDETETEALQTESKGVRVFPQPTKRFTKTRTQDLHFISDDNEPAPPAVTKAKTKPNDFPTPPILEQAHMNVSLMNRGTASANTTGAMAWAEKVKQSLEKAEAARKPASPYQPSEDFIASLGKLSFFRRGAIAEEKSSN